MSNVLFRTAGPSDADSVARLHADSWRRYYRGAYADAYLDGDVVSDRQAVWSTRLASQGLESRTILAEQDDELVGFVHVVFDNDERWGALVDNLHVVHSLHRQGVGSQLMTRAGQAVVDRGPAAAIFLWVLEQNSRARSFYEANGATCAERSTVEAPGGVAGRLNGAPVKLRYVWPDAHRLLS